MVSESIGRSRGRERPIGLSTLRHDGAAEHHRVILGARLWQYVTYGPVNVLKLR
jgi:hypothetical protein